MQKDYGSVIHALDLVDAGNPGLGLEFDLDEYELVIIGIDHIMLDAGIAEIRYSSLELSHSLFTVRADKFHPIPQVRRTTHEPLQTRVIESMVAIARTGIHNGIEIPHSRPYMDNSMIEPRPSELMANRTAKFQLGQVVRHRLLPFRGVIFDVDPTFSNTEEWWQSIPENIRPSKDQPFYHLLAENEQTSYVAYVSEQNLLADESGDPVRHPAVDEMFGELSDGLYVLDPSRTH